MVRKPTELRPLMVRIPEGLRRKLEKEATRNDRSMNAEIIYRLDQSFTIPRDTIHRLVKATNTATTVLEKFTAAGFGTKAGDEGE